MGINEITARGTARLKGSRMRDRIASYALGIVIVLGSAGQLSAENAESFNYGRWWLDASPAIRRAYVSGFNDGILDGISFAWGLSGRVVTQDTRDPGLQLTQQQRRVLAKMHDDYASNRIPADVGVDVVIDNMTYFYRDPANALIYPTYVVRIAILRIRGASAAEVEKELEIARAVASRPR